MQLSLDTILLSTLPALAPRASGGAGAFALPLPDPATALAGQGVAEPGKALPPEGVALPVAGSPPGAGAPDSIAPPLASLPLFSATATVPDPVVVPIASDRGALPSDVPARDAANPVALLAARLAAFVAGRETGQQRTAAAPAEEGKQAKTIADDALRPDVSDAPVLALSSLPLAPSPTVPAPSGAGAAPGSQITPVIAAVPAPRPAPFVASPPALTLVGSAPPVAAGAAQSTDIGALSGLPVLPGGAELDDIMAKIAAVVAPRDAAAPGDLARPVATPAAAVTPAAAALVPIAATAAPTILAAALPTTAEMFGLSARRDAASASDPTLTIAAGTMAHAVAAIAAAGGAEHAPLDLRQEAWPQAMIDRIEALRDAAEETSTRIRVSPDALGPIDLSLRRDGDAVHVRLAAEHAATRTLLTEAQRSLADLADQRGLKLASTTVEHGPGGDQPGRGWRQGEQPAPVHPVSAANPTTAPDAGDDDTRIA